MPTSVDSKELTEHLSPLAATLTKNPGGGFFLTSYPKRIAVLSDWRESKDLSWIR
jgi:hypothetical protein